MGGDGWRCVEMGGDVWRWVEMCGEWLEILKAEKLQSLYFEDGKSPCGNGGTF